MSQRLIGHRGRSNHPEGEDEGIVLSEEAHIGLIVEPVDYRTIQKVIMVSGLLNPNPGPCVSPRIEGSWKSYVTLDWVKKDQILAEIRRFGNPPPLVPDASVRLITRWMPRWGSGNPSIISSWILGAVVEGDIPAHAAQVKPASRQGKWLPCQDTFTGKIIR